MSPVKRGGDNPEDTPGCTGTWRTHQCWSAPLSRNRAALNITWDKQVRPPFGPADCGFLVNISLFIPGGFKAAPEGLSQLSCVYHPALCRRIRALENALGVSFRDSWLNLSSPHFFCL